MVSGYLYVLLLLTDFWGENKFRETVGQCLVGVVSISIIVNFAKLTYNVLKGIKEYLRKKRIQLMRFLRIQEQEELYLLLNNPLLYHKDYIRTYEEEQALITQKKLYEKGQIVHPGILELINNK